VTQSAAKMQTECPNGDAGATKSNHPICKGPQIHKERRTNSLRCCKLHLDWTRFAVRMNLVKHRKGVVCLTASRFTFPI